MARVMTNSGNIGDDKISINEFKQFLLFVSKQFMDFFGKIEFFKKPFVDHRGMKNEIEADPLIFITGMDKRGTKQKCSVCNKYIPYPCTHPGCMELSCGHQFHNWCYTNEVTISGDTRCPICGVFQPRYEHLRPRHLQYNPIRYDDRYNRRRLLENIRRGKSKS
jgi:hypothetical protein